MSSQVCGPATHASADSKRLTQVQSILEVGWSQRTIQAGRRRADGRAASCHACAGLEPRGFFNVVQFVMSDRESAGSVSLQEAMQLVRSSGHRRGAPACELHGDNFMKLLLQGLRSQQWPKTTCRSTCAMGAPS